MGVLETNELKQLLAICGGTWVPGYPMAMLEGKVNFLCSLSLGKPVRQALDLGLSGAQKSKNIKA